MSFIREVKRYEDMSPKGYLRLIEEPDGDLIISIVSDPEEIQLSALGISCQFCMPIFGGGKSPHTRKALLALFEAMELDNKENSQDRG